jgi:hypothetical protein
MHRLTVFATSLLGAGFLGWAIFRNLYPKKRPLVPVNEWGEPIGENKRLATVLDYNTVVVLPASHIFSMPLPWQEKFTDLFVEYSHRIQWTHEGKVHLSLRLPNGRMAKFPNEKCILNPPRKP